MIIFKMIILKKIQFYLHACVYLRYGSLKICFDTPLWATANEVSLHYYLNEIEIAAGILHQVVGSFQSICQRWKQGPELRNYCKGFQTFQLENTKKLMIRNKLFVFWNVSNSAYNFIHFLPTIYKKKIVVLSSRSKFFYDNLVFII